MGKRSCLVSFHRAVSFLLVFVLCLSFCSIVAYGQDQSTISFCVDGISYDIDLQLINGELYCRADQWAQAAGCLWKLNTEQKNLYFYYDTPVILATYSNGAYISENGIPWAPLFDVANQTGIYFSDVVEKTVYGHRAKPLAVFYEDMDRMFAISRYRITELILSLGGFWTVASTASRGYAILSSMSISGFVDAVSGKMDQDVYSAAFIEMLKTDDSLLGVVTDVGEDITRLGKVVNFLQKALDEGSALWEFLDNLGFSESEIHDLVWQLSQVVYGNKTLNDLSDVYEFNKLTKLLGILKVIDDIVVSVEADAHTVMAMQEVFADSESSQMRHAVQKAIGARMGNEALAIGTYTLEYVGDYLVEKAIKEFEEVCEKSLDVGSLEKLVAEGLVWVYDKALSLTEKSDAVIYSEVYSLLQLDLASYYYQHNDDGTPENGMLMHSVALLYLRSCLAAWKLYEFDNSLSASIDNATETLEAEISNLMTYTEEELLQNGTSEDCKQAIVDLVGTNNATPSVPEEPIEDPAEDLFDETYWQWNKGPTNGMNYMVRFHEDGTFEYFSLGSGDLESGEYSYSDGVLVINNSAEYDLQADGSFKSRERYESAMMGGYIHYMLSPSDRATWEQMYLFANPTPAPTPAPTEVPVTKLKSSLPDGEYFVRIDASSYYESGGFLCAEAGLREDIYLSDDYVYSLDVGDIIDLSEFGRADIQIAISDISYEDNYIRITEAGSSYAFYVLSNYNDTDGWNIGVLAGSGAYFEWIASYESLVFSPDVYAVEDSIKEFSGLGNPDEAPWDGWLDAYIIIENGLVTEAYYSSYDIGNLEE